MKLLLAWTQKAVLWIIFSLSDFGEPLNTNRTGGPDFYLTPYQDGHSLYQGLNSYFRFYNQERKHQSLGYQTPAEWYESGKVQLMPRYQQA